MDNSEMKQSSDSIDMETTRLDKEMNIKHGNMKVTTLRICGMVAGIVLLSIANMSLSLPSESSRNSSRNSSINNDEIKDHRILKNHLIDWDEESFHNIIVEKSKRNTPPVASTIQDICADRQVIDFLPRQQQQQRQSNKTNDMDTSEEYTIVMAVNGGFFDFFFNWYSHYAMLDLDLDMVIFAEDMDAYDKLSKANLPSDRVYIVPNDPTYVRQQQQQQQKRLRKRRKAYGKSKSSSSSSSIAFDFNTDGYMNLIAMRPSRLLPILCTGRNIIYVDSDTIWKKNPLPYFTDDDRDGFVSVDVAINRKYAQKLDFCTGLIVLKANPRSLEFVYEWECALLEEKGRAMDQEIFNEVYSRLLTEGPVDRVASLAPLGTSEFPNGQQYFEFYNYRKRQDVVQVHANFMIGSDTKRTKFKEAGYWIEQEQ